MQSCEWGVQNGKQVFILHFAFYTLHLNWLPGLDSHQHKRLQRALSYELDDPAILSEEWGVESAE